MFSSSGLSLEVEAAVDNCPERMNVVDAGAAESIRSQAVESM